MAQYKVAYPYVAAIKTEPEATEATYEKGLALGKMIDVEVTPNYNEASLYGDNALSEYVKEFKDLDVTLNTTSLPVEAFTALFGQTVEENNKEVKANINDIAKYVGFGFVKGEMVENVTTYVAVWFPKVKFTPPAEKCTTKGDSITWNTPSITGKGTSDNAGNWKYMKIFDAENEALEFIKSKFTPAELGG